MLKKIVLVSCCLFATSLVAAEDKEKVKNEILNLKTVLAKRLPEAKPTSIEETPIAGLYLVTVPPQVYYVSADGRYLLDGNMIDLVKNKNLSQQQRSKALTAAIDTMGEDSMIIFEPENVKHTVSVFTDIDCTYCRKLHKEIDQYMALGIKIRYMAYPRAGLDSPSYKKAVSVWCADDKQAAITKAKNGETLPEKTCDNPVTDHYNLGNLIGVRGTPALVFEDGRIYPGYAPAARLISVLEGHPTAKRN